MSDQIARAQWAVSEAHDRADDATVREQLASLERGLGVIDDHDETAAQARWDRLREIESKLVSLLDDTDGATYSLLEIARDAVDRYRQEHQYYSGPNT
jgi:hypothetical protein